MKLYALVQTPPVLRVRQQSNYCRVVPASLRRIFSADVIISHCLSTSLRCLHFVDFLILSQCRPVSVYTFETAPLKLYTSAFTALSYNVLET